MTVLQFSENAFLKAAKGEPNFTEGAEAGKKFEMGAEDFLRSFYADALENEFLDYGLSDLISLARDFWMAGNRREPGKRILNVVPAPKGARSQTRIEIVTDDKSFLVNTVVEAITAAGIEVHGLFHPIVEGFRGKAGLWAHKGTAVRESMILVMVPPQGKRSRTNLEAELKAAMDDVDCVNADYHDMTGEMHSAIKELKQHHGKTDPAVLREGIDFLEWIASGNFVLLGARRYNYMKSAIKSAAVPDYVNPTVAKGHTFGILRDKSAKVLRQSSEPSVILSNVKSFMSRSEPISVAKSNMFSRVHRRVRMDYVSVKHFNDKNEVIGETRFVGLFTATAYSKSSLDIPLIRRKVQRVMERARVQDGTHNASRLKFVLATYPRDELFQISENDLLRISTGVAQAFDRPRTRIFVRRDPFSRFVSILSYIPREHYSTRVRERIGAHLAKAFDGRLSAFYPQYSDAPMARVHFIIGLDPDAKSNPDIDDLETEIANISQPWFENVRNMLEAADADEILSKLDGYENAFSVAYQDKYTPDQTLADISVFETLTSEVDTAVRVYGWSGDDNRTMNVKIYRLENRIEPSLAMPVLTNFGLHIAQQTGYEINRTGSPSIWVHDFEIGLSFAPDDTEALSDVFETAFINTWRGKNEDDAFNQLILPQSANWREIAFLRLVARYRRQSGLDPSEASQIEAFSQHPILTGMLLSLMQAKFDPEAFKTHAARTTGVEAIMSEIRTALNDVASLNHDRVIRRCANAINAGLRTNFYQRDEAGEIKPYISLKIDSQQLESLPAPKPYREIYVSSPRVEGVHLRFGPVARGGLRWSDRRDDFRTEVLGLVKAQQVKNAVIVPVGSKGGFYPKQLPTGGDRDAVREEAIAAYTVFISGLLDLTDNYKGDDVIAPPNVVCWDDPDPYLVVAADKGTATFSDIANGISQSYGFWLDDAFASGGSAGYDHKAMGITARGGWEAVKRHFREMGKDIQSEEFTVIGIGDMSGDVFGNGMLLSEHIKLLAAFDHRDIFIDPNPDAAKSFKERKRIFELPRSSWADYNKKLISKGGGVFSRSEKSITLTPEIKELTGLSANSVTPDELLKALLKTPTELLWFGGIGTYIKAASQSHSDVGDKANDLIRVNATEVKAKVIGEGANLGMTQAGRIAYARKGGRINTDAIDNSAGVDSSDNEVNIKILLGGAIEAGTLKRKNRNALLEKMTDEVATLVLQHNYDQTEALSLAQSLAVEDHNSYERFMMMLEKAGRLNRTVEGLPSTEAMQAMENQKVALTRPELAVLLAYSKIVLFDDLIDTDIAEDPYMESVLEDYFPAQLKKYTKAREGHRLRREIIVSRLVNRIVDVCGPLFVMHLREQTQASVLDIAKGFIVAYEALRIDEMRIEISELDNIIDAHSQIQLHGEIAIVMQRVAAWMVRRNEAGTLSERIIKRKHPLTLVDSGWLDFLSPYDARRAEARIKRFVKGGVPEDLAADVSLLRSRASGFDVIALSEKTGWDVSKSAALFYETGARFKIDRIRAALLTTEANSHWERLALRHLQEEFFEAQARFALLAAQHHLAAKGDPSEPCKVIIQNWVKDMIPTIKAYESSLAIMAKSRDWTVAKFTIINAQLRELKQGTA